MFSRISNKQCLYILILFIVLWYLAVNSEKFITLHNPETNSCDTIYDIDGVNSKYTGNIGTMETYHHTPGGYGDQLHEQNHVNPHPQLVDNNFELEHSYARQLRPYVNLGSHKNYYGLLGWANKSSDLHKSIDSQSYIDGLSRSYLNDRYLYKQKYERNLGAVSQHPGVSD